MNRMIVSIYGVNKYILFKDGLGSANEEDLS